MSLTRKIAWNTSLQIIGRIVGTILGLLAVAVLTRYLGTAGYGAFTTVTSFLQFFGILADFGLTLTATSMISEPGSDERKIMSNIFSLRLISAIIFFGLAPIVVMFFPYPEHIKLGVAIGSLAFFGMTQSQVLIGVFQKYLKMNRSVIAEIAGRAVLFLGIIIVAKMNFGFLATIWALVAGNAVQFGLSFLFAQKLVRFKLEFNKQIIKNIIWRSWPIALSIAFNLVYLKGDIIILSLFRSQSEIGLYGAAYKVLDVLTVIPMMFMGMVLPILVDAWKKQDKETFKRRLQKAFDFSAIVAVPLVAGAIVLGKDIMALVAGKDFRMSGEFLAILMFAVLAVFFSGLYGHTIIAIQKQKASIWGYAIDAVLSLIGYFIFVPRFGALGAAWVTVFSEAFIALYTFGLVFKTTRISPNLKILDKTIFASLLMAVVLIYIKNTHVLLQILIGAVIYFVFIFTLRGLTIQTLKEFFPGKNNE